MGDRAALGPDRRHRDCARFPARRDSCDGCGHSSVTGQAAGGMQIGPALLLLLPQLGTVVTGVMALIAEMLRQPAWGRRITIGGLLVSAALGLPRLRAGHLVFGRK